MCGYAISEKYAMIWGRPLCDDSQIETIANAVWKHLQEKKLKPIWACVDEATEKVLSDKLHWSCLVAAAEQRVDPTALGNEGPEKAVAAKIRRAEREGVRVTAVDGELKPEIKEQVNKRMKDWQANRHGTQIYSAGLRPWDDPGHRRYFYATDKEGTVRFLLVQRLKTDMQ